MRVIVTGVPGSGKTTLATDLAAALGVRYISKDLIKEALWDALGPGDLTWSQALGAAASDALFQLAQATPSAVIDHPVPAAFAAQWAALPGLVEVHCTCPGEVARDRYASRRRHPCHFDGDRIADYDEWLRDDASRPALGLRLDVDTSTPVDLDAVNAWVRANAS